MLQAALHHLISPGKPYLGSGELQTTNAPRQLLMCATVDCASKARKPLQVLEIGSWLGGSALTWAEAMNRFCPGGGILCVDPWEPYHARPDRASRGTFDSMDDLSRAGVSYEIFNYNMGFVPSSVNVRHFRGRFRDVSNLLRRKYFDIVYIDGSHYYEDVLFDIETAKELVVEGGIICGDDLEAMMEDVDSAHVDENLNADFVTYRNGEFGYHPGVTKAVHEAFGSVFMSWGYWGAIWKNGQAEPINLYGSQSFIPSHFTPEMRQVAVQYRQEIAG